jgi:hypothetical protein
MKKSNWPAESIAHPWVLISSQSSLSTAIFFIDNWSEAIFYNKNGLELHFLILSHITYSILIQLFEQKKINLTRGLYCTPAGIDQISFRPVQGNLFHWKRFKIALIILSHIIYCILIQLFKDKKFNLVRGHYCTPAGMGQISISPVRGNLFHWKQFKIAFINIITLYITF